MVEWDGSWIRDRGLAEAEGGKVGKHGGAAQRTSISCSSSGDNLQLNRPQYHLFYSAASIGRQGQGIEKVTRGSTVASRITLVMGRTSGLEGGVESFLEVLGLYSCTGATAATFATYWNVSGSWDGCFLPLDPGWSVALTQNSPCTFLGVPEIQGLAVSLVSVCHYAVCEPTSCRLCNRFRSRQLCGDDPDNVAICFTRVLAQTGAKPTQSPPPLSLRR